MYNVTTTFGNDSYRNLLRTTASQGRDFPLPGLPARQAPGEVVQQPSRGRASLVSWLPAPTARFFGVR